MSDIIAFSDAQQAAVLGHAFQQPKIWDLLKDLGFKTEWLTLNQLAEMYKQIDGFKDKFSRYPKSLAEFKDSVKDELLKESIARASKVCLEAKARHGWDILEGKLVQWAKSRALFLSVHDIAEKFNSGKHSEAAEAWSNHNTELQRIDGIIGNKPDQFVSSAVRAREEQRERIEDASNSLPYAVTLLQDCLYGMLPSDVILLAARTGAGKTELAKIFASYIAKLGLPVHYFALEANSNEIERRIKYGLMGQWFKDDHPEAPQGVITYAKFVHCKIEKELSPYEDRAQEAFEKDYKTLNTYYRRSKDFGLRDLEREVWNLKGRSRLIVLDHIHYIDCEGRNENAEMTEVIKGIRDMSLATKIPIIIVAHIKKASDGRKGKALIPDLNEVHGSSNLTKIATTTIMMAKVRGGVVLNSQANGYPTFLKILKCRLDGSHEYYNGMAFFNPFSGQYSSGYAIGTLNASETKWTPAREMPHWVNRSRLITDVAEIGE